MFKYVYIDNIVYLGNRILRNIRKILFAYELWNFKPRWRPIPILETKYKQGTNEKGNAIRIRNYRYLTIYNKHNKTKKQIRSRGKAKSNHVLNLIFVKVKNKTKIRRKPELNSRPFACQPSAVTTEPPALQLSNELNEYIIIKSKPDGHCLLHSIVTISRLEYENFLTVNELIIDIRREFFMHIDYYRSFSPEEDIIKQLNHYIQYKQYSSTIGDMMPLIISNVIHQDIRIYYRDMTLAYTVTPRNKGGCYSNAFKVMLSAEHYDALVEKREVKNKHNKTSISSDLIKISTRKQMVKTKSKLPKLYLLNIQSLAKPHAMELLGRDLNNNNIDIAFITETHLNDRHDSNIISTENYTIIRKDRLNQKGGGVAIFLRKEHQFKNIEQDSEHEILWIQATIYSKIFAISVVYHPPHKKYNINIIDRLDASVESITLNHPESSFIIAGDFNELNQNEIMERTGLSQINKTPTRNNSILDHVYVSNDISYKTVVCKSIVKSDHLSVIAYDDKKAHEEKVTKNRIKHEIRIRKPRQIALMHEKLSTQVIEFNDGNFQDSCHSVYETITQHLNDFFPIRSITTTTKDPPFITPYIKILLRKRNKLMKKGRIHEADAIALEINQRVIRNNSKILAKKNAKNISKEMWTSVREVYNKSKNYNKEPSSLTAQDFILHYTSISTDSNYQTPLLKSGPTQTAEFFETWEIHKSLKHLKSTATGDDEIPAWFLKLAADYIAQPITTMINQSIKQGIVPTQWKTAIIVPVPKVTKPTTPVDYRPISITPVLSRMCEKMIIKKYLYQAITGNREFNNQFAFRPTGSTTAAIIATLKEVVTILQEHKYSRLVALDFSKAFDTIRHSSLFQKLANLDAHTEIYNWLVDFFKERKQRSKFHGTISDESIINCGVVQGSALGPVMFSVTASDLQPINPSNKMIKYADDTCIIMPPSKEESIKEELKNIASWSEQNNLKLNENKSKEIVITRPRYKGVPDQINIKRVNTLNILGVQISDKLSMEEHVASQIKKCNAIIYGLKILKSKGMSSEDIHQVYRALVINKLLYASPAWWGYLTKNDENRIRSYVKRSIRYGYCNSNADAGDINSKAESKLFRKICSDRNHVLNQYIIPLSHGRQLRNRPHQYARVTLNDINKKDFLNRMLHFHT